MAKQYPVLNDISDVVFTSPSTGQVVKFNGSQWTNQIESGGSNGTFPAPVNKTANYTVTSSDHLITVDATSGAVAITLPTAVSIPGKQYYVAKVDSSANAVTLATTSSQTINGLTTRSTDLQWDVIGVESDNANWIGVTPPDASGGGGGGSGTVVSIENVSPDTSGNIDLITGANQTITPGTNSITFAVTDDGIGSKVEDSAPASAQYRFITKLPLRASGNRARLFLEIEGGPGWFAGDEVHDYFQFANYSFFDYVYRRYGNANERTNLSVVCYEQGDTSVDVYLRSTAGVSTSSIVRAQAKDIPTGTDSNLTPGTPGTTVPSGTLVFDSSATGAYGDLQVGNIYQNDTRVGTSNYTPYAYPVAFPVDAATATTVTLPASGGTVVIPMLLTAAQRLESVSFWSTDTATSRGPVEFAVFEDPRNNSNSVNRIPSALGTLSAFTPTVASLRTIPVTTPPALIPAGVYWLALKNNSASQNLAIGTVQGGFFQVSGANLVQTKTLTTSAFGSTLDMVAATWAKQTYHVAARFNGRVFNQSALF